MGAIRRWVLASSIPMCIAAASACASAPNVVAPSSSRFVEATVPTDTVRCVPMPILPDTRYPVVPDRKVEIRFPTEDPIAMVIVPAGSFPDAVTFILGVPEATPYVAVRMTAEDDEGVPFTDLPDGIEFRLLFRNGCEPDDPADGQSFYIYWSPEDRSRTERTGEWNDATFWDRLFLRQFTPRVDAIIDHLSRYLIAQG